jgi:hypothetical protein
VIRSELELLKRQDQRNRRDNKHMLSHKEKKKMILDRRLIEAKDLKEFDTIFENFQLYTDENAYLFLTALCSGEKIVNFGRSNEDCPDSQFVRYDDLYSNCAGQYKRNLQLNDWSLETDLAFDKANISIISPDSNDLYISILIKGRYEHDFSFMEHYIPIKKMTLSPMENELYKKSFELNILKFLPGLEAIHASCRDLKIIWNIHQK